MRRAAIYARISSDPQGRRLGVERQIADCERLAADLGWEVHDTYVDNDTSAWSGKARPEYQRLCEDIKAGTGEALVGGAADRLHPDPRGVGGLRPYGYTADRLHIVPEEAAVVREAACRIIAGESQRSVASDFNERG